MAHITGGGYTRLMSAMLVALLVQVVHPEHKSVVHEEDSAPKMCTVTISPKGPLYACLITDDNAAIAAADLMRSGDISALTLAFGGDHSPIEILHYMANPSRLKYLVITSRWPIDVKSNTFAGLDNLIYLKFERDLPIARLRHTKKTLFQFRSSPHVNSTFYPEGWNTPSTFERGWLIPLSNLKRLDLTISKILQFEPNEFCGLNQLEYLDLSNNKLNDSSKLGISCNASFGQSSSCQPCLPNLIMLSTSHNNLDILYIEPTVELPKLRWLIVKNCSTVQISPSFHVVLTSVIESIDFSQNRLVSLTVDIQKCNATKLTKLFLHDNLIQSVSPGLFSCVPQLIHLNLQRNKLALDTLINANISILSHLQFLDLSGNYIDRLPSIMLANMQKLQNFSCSDCKMHSIENDSFLNLTGLKVLYLNKNNLSFISSSLFSKLMSLEILDLSENNLVVVDMLSYLPNIKELYISRNNLHHIPELSSTQTQLSVMDIGWNRITGFRQSQLHHISSLRELSLDHNNITNIPKNALMVFLKLERLNLATNNIRTIHKKAFEYLIQLRYLELNENSISEFPVIVGLAYLCCVNLSQNLIETVPPVNMQRLVSIDLSWNSISSITMFQTATLQFVNLTNNNLHHVEKGTFYWTCQTTYCAPPEVLLRGNPLHCDCRLAWILDVNSNLDQWDLFKRRFHDSSSWLHNANQRFNVKPALTKMFYLKVPDLDDLYCNNRGRHAGRTITSLESYDFVCPYDNECDTWICPCCHTGSTCKCDAVCYPGCACVHAHFHESNIVYCSYRNMTCLPRSRPYYAHKLLLDGNYLTHLSADDFKFPLLKELYLNRSHVSVIAPYAFSQLPAIRLIDLRDNDIAKVERFTFAKISDLETLHLQNNKIHLIENDSFVHLLMVKTLNLHGNNLSSINLGVFDKMPSLTVLTLHGNPWRCDCSFGAAFKLWLARHSKIIQNLNDVRCLVNFTEGPTGGHGGGKATHVYNTGIAALTNKSVINVDFSFCQRPIYIQSLLGILGTSGALIVLGIVIVIVYSNRLLFMIWAYNHWGVQFRNEDDDNSDKPYDVGVGCIMEDEDFVFNELRPELEDGRCSYRVCLESRDWPTGKVHTEIITAAVQQCKRTILLVSEKSQEANMWRYYFHMAHYQVLEDRQLRLILVVSNRNLLSKLEGVLKHYMRSGTYVVIGEKGFWAKLKYFMANNPRGALDVNDPNFEELNINKNRS